MVDYKKMYTIMFNAASDAINILQKHFDSKQYDLIDCAVLLANAQTECEEIYISSTEE